MKWSGNECHGVKWNGEFGRVSCAQGRRRKAAERCPEPEPEPEPEPRDTAWKGELRWAGCAHGSWLKVGDCAWGVTSRPLFGEIMSAEIEMVSIATRFPHQTKHFERAFN
jgi:hypothetical protein